VLQHLVCLCNQNLLIVSNPILIFLGNTT